MKVTESQLRGIISRVIEEALSRDVINGANRYLNHKGGYTTNQNWDGLGGLIKQGLGAKKDVNGQMDWQNSANDIEGYIRSYSNEIKRLGRVYNAITGHQVQGWSDERKAKAANTRAFNSQWKKDNDVQTSAPQWQNNSRGSMDSTKYRDAAARMRGMRNDVASKGNQSWFNPGLEESVDEGFFQNLFNRKNQPDEVDQICQNYKQYIGNADAAKKVSDKIQEYKGIVQKLKAIIASGKNAGHIVDKSAQDRAAMNAARKAAEQPRQYRQVAEAIARNLSKALRSLSD